MKHLLAAFLILLAFPAHAQWMSSTETLIPIGGEIPLWRFNSSNGKGVVPGAHPTVPAIPEGVMTQIDLLPLGVPIDAIAVHITSLLIITHGTMNEICDLQIRIDGVAQIEQPYIGQSVEAHRGGGQRTNFSVIAPVNNGFVGIRWDGLSGADWPSGCAFGGNFVIDAVFR